jgi:hypothetical protein
MTLTVLGFHERPIDSDDSLALEAFQRFWKRQEPRARLLVKADFAEIGSALRRSHRHHAIIFQERLKIPIGLGFLPQCVDLGRPGFLHDHPEPDGLYFEQFHQVFCRVSVSDASALKKDGVSQKRPTTKKSPPENYGKEDQTTVAAFLLWRGS